MLSPRGAGAGLGGRPLGIALLWLKASGADEGAALGACSGAGLGRARAGEPLGTAAFTSTILPSMLCMAWASTPGMEAAEAKMTKPKPRLLRVSRLYSTWAEATSPNWAKYSRRRSSSVE